MKYQKPCFSIIIPTLNEEHDIPKLIQCLVKQEFYHFEVIVVDGNSNDKTIKMVKHYKTKLARLQIIKTPRRNPAYQRNLGARKACGSYLIFFDADITIPSNFLSTIFSVIKTRHSFFLTTWMDGDIKTLNCRLIMFMYNIGMEIARILGIPIAWGLNIIISKPAFQKVKGFREDLFMSEDHDFSIRVVKTGFPLTILKKPRLVMSLRRLLIEGFWTTQVKYISSMIQYLIKGKINRNNYDYQMGGHIHYKRET